MEAVSGAMVARWRGRVATTVVSVSLLLAVFLLFLRNQPPSVVCPDSDSSQLPHQHQQTAQQFDDDVFRLRSEPSRRNRSERNEFQLGVVRPTDSLPTVAKTTAAAAAATESKSRARQPFVLHRCPPSYDISDAQDEWFRTQVVQRSPPTSQVKFTDEILIVTPIRNSETHLRRYFENLCSLAYPHRLLSVVLGEDSSEDKTVQLATELVDELSSFFKRVALVRLPGKAGYKEGNSRHDRDWQLARRQHIALVRNRLLSAALSLVAGAGVDLKWVLWLDSDIRHVPRDLIRLLLSANQSVVVPNCLWRLQNGQTATFDRNTWRETRLSLSEQALLGRDELVVEGYGSFSKRLFLNDLKTESDLVRVDGVGGCVLLVAADLHRSGLVFPPFVFDHHIETEGLAKMAARMGVKLYALPSVNVIHA